MESLLSLTRVHWDHEPERAQRRAGVPPAQRARQRERFRSAGVADGGRRDACPTLRFLESAGRRAALLSPVPELRWQRRAASKLQTDSKIQVTILSPLLRVCPRILELWIWNSFGARVWSLQPPRSPIAWRYGVC